VVGAPGRGAAYTFALQRGVVGGSSALTWASIARADADDEGGGAAADFGETVAVCPPAIAVGAPKARKASQTTGALFVFG
jgi:hypothetical protein